MSFTIVSSASPDYAEMVRLCVPSWVRYSGASRIELHSLLETTETDPVARWIYHAGVRCLNIGSAVLEGCAIGKHRAFRHQVLALDVDCVTLKDVSGGFSPDHPISIARWPDPNIGVIFFNTLLDWDFTTFMETMAKCVMDNCIRIARHHEGVKWMFCDQHVWRDLLLEHQDAVCKLDMNEWNFCHQPGDWQRELKVHRDRIRIAHFKVRPGHRAEIWDSFRETFPGILEET